MTNTTTFSSSYPGHRLVMDTIKELREQGRLVYPQDRNGREIYNEAQTRDQLVSKAGENTWKEPHHFANTAHSVLRTYMLNACNLQDYDLRYESKEKNREQLLVTTRHNCRPADKDQDIQDLIERIEHLFPKILIRRMVEQPRGSRLTGVLTIVKWRPDDICVLHQIKCTFRVNRPNSGTRYNASAHVFYYKIDVSRSRADDENGLRTRELLRTMADFMEEQELEGRLLPDQGEGEGSGNRREGDDGDGDGDGLAQDLASQCNISQ